MKRIPLVKFENGFMLLLLSFHLAPFSASHFRITSATWRLFLSIIIMWLLPLMPMSGRTASAARPPAALIALTASRQPLRLASPLTVCLAPTLLSPHSESTGTLAKYEAASLSVKPSHPPSTVTSARTSFGRWRTRSRSEERRVGKEGRSRWSPYH